jgi:hypothetical protein
MDKWLTQTSTQYSDDSKSPDSIERSVVAAAAILLHAYRGSEQRSSTVAHTAIAIGALETPESQMESQMFL